MSTIRLSFIKLHQSWQNDFLVTYRRGIEFQRRRDDLQDIETLLVDNLGFGGERPLGCRNLGMHSRRREEETSGASEAGGDGEGGGHDGGILEGRRPGG